MGVSNQLEKGDKMGENTFQILKKRYEAIGTIDEIGLSEKYLEVVAFIKELNQREFNDLCEILSDKYWKPKQRL